MGVAEVWLMVVGWEEGAACGVFWGVWPVRLLTEDSNHHVLLTMALSTFQCWLEAKQLLQGHVCEPSI